MRSWSVAIILGCVVACGPAVCAQGGAAAGVGVGEAGRYRAGAQVSGVIRFWGSPQMRELLHRYEAGFSKVQPGVRFEEELFSTVTAVAGVYTGRADIGLLGREMWPTEAEAFQSVMGHGATVVDVATGSLDVPKATFALMVFVAKANPLASLSTEQLEEVFGSAAGGHAVRTWGALGLGGVWSARPIHLYGFATENDKSRIFSDLIFRKDEGWSSELASFSNGLGPKGKDAGQLVVDAVERDPEGIGISNIHYATEEVKALPLRVDGGAAIAATRATVGERRYPLTRAVYMVVDLAPGKPARPAVTEFLRFALSREGQEAVREEGNYLPLTPAIADRELGKLGRGGEAR